jgi:hypothetical protein
MKEFRFVLVILTLGLIQNVCGQDNRIPKQELIFDYHLFRNALEEAHPGLYRYVSKEKLDSLFTACESKLNAPLTQREFYKFLVPLVDEIQCGHTKLMPIERAGYPYYYHTNRLFPMKLFIDHDRAFVIDFYRIAPGVQKGDEVISINGKPMPEIIHELLGCVFSDGENMTLKYYELNRYFSAYYADFLDVEDSEEKAFSVGVLKDGHTSEKKIEAVSLEQVLATENAAEGAGIFNLSFEENATAILTIPFFWNPEKGPGFKKFLSESFGEINERNTEHLIIDLRNNEGGKEVYGSLLLSYLMDHEFPYYDYLEITQKKSFSFSEYASVPLAFKFLKMLFKQTDSGRYEWKGHKNCGPQKPAKNNYKGNVYVMINGGSFSVATEFASVVKSLNRAVFIGEETGGGYYGNTSGFFTVVKLPHSDLELGVPLIGFYSKVQPTQYENRGVFPDYEISPSVLGVLSKKDEVLDYVLDIIKLP